MGHADRRSRLESARARHLEELFELLRIPSVSAHSSSKETMYTCAHWLRQKLEDAGLQAVVDDTDRWPVVYGERLVDPSLPTVLIYGHYDVQPPDPLDLWTTPPFEPTVRDGNIYARGATDDKGQMYSYVKALEVLQHEPDVLNRLNIKMIIEGEEEVGSPSLRPYLDKYKERLACDVILISDSSMYAPGKPSVMIGLRGLSYLEVKVEGPSHDLHSGLYGGAAPNPIHALSQMIASLHDADGRVTVPGFYDDVLALSDDEREVQRAYSQSSEAFCEEIGANQEIGERGYSILERTTSRPCLDINGIWGGYIEEGSKTVLPSKAEAKLSCRLVPHQDPHKIAKLVGEHLVRIAPPAYRATYFVHDGGAPYLADPSSKAVEAVCAALHTVWNAEALKLRGGGSIPIVSDFKQVLGADSVLMGLGLNDDRLHSPDEKFGLENYYQGIRACAEALTQLGREDFRAR